MNLLNEMAVDFLYKIFVLWSIFFKNEFLALCYSGKNPIETIKVKYVSGIISRFTTAREVSCVAQVA